MAATEEVKSGDVSDFRSKAAATTLVGLFNQGVLAPSFGTGASGGDNDTSVSTGGTTSFPVVNTVLTSNESTKTLSQEAVQAAITQLQTLTPQQQYDVILDQVQKQYGDLFEHETEEQLAASNALLYHNQYQPSTLITRETNTAREMRAYVTPMTSFISMEEKRDDTVTLATTDTSNDRVVTYVKSELESLIADSSSKSISGRGVGADRAFTKIGDPLTTADVKKQLNLTEQDYRRVDLEIDTSLLTSDAAAKVATNNLIMIEAGAYVGDVCDHYWPIDKYGSTTDENGTPYKVLPNRGGYKLLSLVGLSSVGAMGFSTTDGTTCNIGAIQSAIQSLEILTVEDGKVVQYQIEPKTDAIHTSDAVATLAGKGITLIQDDQTFSDVVTSMGCYGIITRVIINMDDAYYLEEKREKVTLDKWEDKYDEIISNPDVYVFEAWFNPYYLTKLTPDSMVITYWLKSDGPPSSQEDIEKHAGAERGSISLSAMKASGFALQVLASAGLWQGVSVGMDISLNQTLFTKGYDSFIMSYVQAVDFGTPNGMPTQTSGNSFPVNKTKDVVNGYVQFLNDVGKTGDKLLITSPFALRFSKKSYGSVSCAGEYDVSWIEQPILTVGKGSLLTFAGYRTALEKANRLLNQSRQYFQENFTSKIHWGLYFDEQDAMPADYPWFQHISTENKDSFYANYTRFNKDGVFKNGFTTRAGMSP